ncbi:MAG: 50S ribosomal protein L4 [Proteobacteria bacterium]|nr:50S ribosomal protein L4 [Pseudomonadota bacterium]MCP4918243.1 50S ribosomal protein L4 [Pseudomonadota bacterium]
MPTIDVYNTSREKVGDLSLDDAIFGAEVKEHLFYTMVRYQMAKRRQGTHKVKGRAEVSGGGRKPFRQKGTGRARQGTTRAPHMRGGGVVFGPTPRDHSHKLPKKVRAAALRSALSRRVEEDSFTIFDAFETDGKTKSFAGVLSTFEFDGLLLILSEKDENVLRSARNIPGVKVLPVAGLNVYDILDHKNVAATKDAIAGITARLGS